MYNQVYHPRCRVRERRCSPLERLCARGERVRLLLYPATSRLHLETTTVDFGQVAVVKRKVVLPLKRLMSTLGVTTRADGELKTQMRMTLNYGMKPNNK